MLFWNMSTIYKEFTYNNAEKLEEKDHLLGNSEIKMRWSINEYKYN